MTTINKTYRARKFFLCSHQCEDKMIGFEPAKERFTQYTFLSYGSGKFYFFYENYDDGIKIVEESTEKKLYDLKEFINCDVVAQSKSNTKIISFNSWRKTENWNGRLINKSEIKIKTNENYACIICFEGTCYINGKKFKTLDFADILKDKEYEIEINDDSYIGLFELISNNS